MIVDTEAWLSHCDDVCFMSSCSPCTFMKSHLLSFSIVVVQQRIVHRDVAVRNVLVGPSCTAKVCVCLSYMLTLILSFLLLTSFFRRSSYISNLTHCIFLPLHPHSLPPSLPPSLPSWVTLVLRGTFTAVKTIGRWIDTGGFLCATWRPSLLHSNDSQRKQTYGPAVSRCGKWWRTYHCSAGWILYLMPQFICREIEYY